MAIQTRNLGGRDSDLQSRLTVINFRMILSLSKAEEIPRAPYMEEKSAFEFWAPGCLTLLGTLLIWLYHFGGILFSFPISISPHTSVKCKINLSAAKTKLISKQWKEQRQSAALRPRTARRACPPHVFMWSLKWLIKAD